jgi:hypothetical protein
MRTITLETGSSDRVGNMSAFATRALEFIRESIEKAPAKIA